MANLFKGKKIKLGSFSITVFRKEGPFSSKNVVQTVGREEL